MAFSNFGDLKTEIAGWLKRDNQTDRIPSFVALCEADMRSRLRPNDLEARTTITIDAEYVDVPVGMRSVNRLTLDGADNVPLRYISPELMEDQWSSSSTGKPLVFTLVGNQFQFRPVPSSSFTGNLVYQAVLTALAADTDTNFVLTNHPDTYLYGSLMQAWDYLNSTEQTAKYEALYEKCIDRIKRESAAKRVGGGIRIRPATYA